MAIPVGELKSAAPGQRRPPTSVSTIAPQQEIASRRYGRYFVRDQIGQGGMAEVYRADVVDDGVLSTVALKVLKPDQPTKVADLFFAEADLMGLMNHPNLVKRLEVGSYAGRLFIAMEDQYGGDLQALLRFLSSQDPPERLPPGSAFYICIQVLHGLAYFHQAKSTQGSELGLVHGDLNPSNVMFSAYGDVKLGDFGVASIPGVGAGIEEGVAAGKLHYLSPEQVTGLALTSQSDLFSMGTMLFNLLFNHFPFEATEEDEVLEHIRHARYKLPPGTDPDLTQIFKRCLSRSLKDRYQTAGEMAGDLLCYQLDRGLQFARGHMQDVLDRVLGIAS